MMAIRTSTEVIKKLIDQNKYQWVSGPYINATSKIELVCPEGHKWTTTWKRFKEGARCPVGINKPKTSEEIHIETLKHGYKWVSGVHTGRQNGKRVKLTLQCPRGHEYETTYGLFQEGYRCPICFGKIKHKLVDLKTIASSYDFEILSDEYVGSSHKMRWKCPKGHIEEFSWRNFKKYKNCPKCSKNRSTAEKEIFDWLASLDIKVEQNNKKLIGQELDIYLPEHKLAIEHNGLYWHSEKFCDKNYHINKLERCLEKGIRLITIFEDEWKNKKEQVKSIIVYNLNSHNLIYNEQVPTDIIISVDRRFSEGDVFQKLGLIKEVVAPKCYYVKSNDRISNQKFVEMGSPPKFSKIWDCGSIIYSMVSYKHTKS